MPCSHIIERKRERERKGENKERVSDSRWIFIKNNAWTLICIHSR